MDSRGQGALEYLLLIAGAILVAAVILWLLSSQTSSTGNTISNAINTQSSALDAIGNATYG